MMLFNSYEFIFLFLPLTLAGYCWTRQKFGSGPAYVALMMCSIAFYCQWKAEYIFLILCSSLGNYALGQWIARAPEKRRTLVLIIGVTANIALLAYFKYARFLVENISMVTGHSWAVPAIELPLGISFFTFTQIAYLVDVRTEKISSGSILRYILFVVFFPHLIAGPIIHYKELVPQFERPTRNVWRFAAVGVLIFAVGLFKKTVIADALALYASPVFDTAAQGRVATFFEAWAGALAYTLQLYFDFSAYSDMAVGIAALFGIRFPVNFNSPYRARNIIDFWRRWHITLSRFLRDYLYFALGGNRCGSARRYTNLMVTMLLGGLWHGADWKFLLWGGLHGAFLMVNHGWRHVRPKLGQPAGGRAESLACWALTFTAVVIAWVPFRAANLDTAFALMGSMAGLHGIALPNALAGLAHLLPKAFTVGAAFDPVLADWPKGMLVIGFACLIAWLLPNVYQVLVPADADPLIDDEGRRSLQLISPRWPVWAPSSWRWAAAAAAFGVFGVLGMSHVSEFLYFQF